MKVLFFITARSTGLGGHFYSLRSIAEALQNDASCMVVNIGKVQAKALQGTSVPLREVISPRLSMVWRFRELHRLVREFKPDVLHSFDQSASFYARAMGLMFKRPVVATKCGGPNPSRYFPLMKTLVVFSREDETFFKTTPRYRNTNIQLIPNRVNEVPQAANRIQRLRREFSSEDIVFLRIGRVATCYLDLSLGTLSLVKRLREDGVRARFLHIGVINDSKAAEHIRAQLGEQDRLVTDPEFTLGASEMIEAGDFLVGTGRGLMEAASRGRVLLAPIQGSSFPALVTPDNWEHLFQTNFSPRGVIPNFEQDSNYQAILAAVQVRQDKIHLEQFSRKMFEQWFSVTSAIPMYMELYRNLGVINQSHPFDLALQGLYSLWRN